MEVCIRHGQTIKSRQWWLNNLKKIKRLLLNGLAKSKAKLIKKANVKYTILRPETVIGKDAYDFRRLVEMMKKTRIFPMIGLGKNTIQPIGITDLIRIMEYSIENNKTDNKSYSIVGKEVITTKDFLKKISHKIGGRRLFFPIP